MESHHPTGMADAPSITGATVLIGILADPISHIQTPQRLNAWFKANRHDAVLVPMHVAASDLDGLIQGLRRIRNLGGLIVTVPHKEAIVRLCDELGDEAAMTGAVNAVRRLPDGRLRGENFDGAGFVGGLHGKGIDPRGHNVLLAGAGGAARAIGFALAKAGIGSLVIANRSPARANDLAQAIRARFPQLAVTIADDNAEMPVTLIVNATTLGMKENDALPVPEIHVRPGIVVAEAIMKPARTRLLACAEMRGCRIHEGVHMLEAQVRLLGNFVLGAQQSCS